MRKPLAAGLAAVALPVAIVALLIWLTPYYSTILGWELWKSLFWLVPLAVGVALVGVVLVLSESVGLAGVTAVVLFAGWIAWVGFLHPYAQDAEYVAASHEVTDQLPAFTPRTPYETAVAQVGANLGDVNGDTLGTAYLPATGHFGTLVAARGLLTGYEGALEQTTPLSGRGTGSFCPADPDGAALGSSFGHNLGRRIAELDRGLNYSTSDAYGYCDPTTHHPMVVVPLKSQTGWMIVTERPAGVAVYDAATQALDVRPSSAGLPGPSYPLSLAQTQREALPAVGSLTDYIFDRVGYEAPDGEVNSAGAAEFVLGTGGAGEQYVTPLTGRGSAQSISAISTVSAAAADGDLAPLIVHRLTPTWVSIAAIEKRIQGDFNDIPNWQTLQVMELVPLDGQHWAATIGNGQNVLYRVTGTGTLADPGADTSAAVQPTRLQRVEGGQLVDVQRGSAFNTNGAGPGVAPGAAATTPGNAAAGGGTDPLGGYTSQQLLTELQRRLAGAGR